MVAKSAKYTVEVYVPVHGWHVVTFRMVGSYTVDHADRTGGVERPTGAIRMCDVTAQHVLRLYPDCEDDDCGVIRQLPDQSV